MASKAMLDYKIIVSGVSFQLSEASPQSDSLHTNLLAMSLLGDFAEAEKRSLVLDRDAITFRLVRDHLAGYTVIPFDDQDHIGMSRVKFLQYLQNDCEYYGLQRLQGIVEGYIDRRKEPQPAAKCMKQQDEQQKAADTPEPPSLETYIQGHIAELEAWKVQLLCAKAKYDRSPGWCEERDMASLGNRLAEASSALNSILAQRRTQR